MSAAEIEISLGRIGIIPRCRLEVGYRRSEAALIEQRHAFVKIAMSQHCAGTRQRDSKGKNYQRNAFLRHSSGLPLTFRRKKAPNLSATRGFFLTSRRPP